MNKIITVFILFATLIFLLSAAYNPANYPEEEILLIINELRREQDLPPLVHNWEAARVARYKAEDMKTHNYFGHDSPVYGSFFDMLKNFHIHYNTAGENIATGAYPTPQTALDAWLIQAQHRQNIFSKHFNSIGIGYSTDGVVHYWCLIFLC